MNVYAPNSLQLCFLRKVFKLITHVKYGQLLMCGDFNLTVDPSMNSSSATKGRSPSLRDYYIQREYMMSEGANMLRRGITHSSPQDIIPTPA